MNIDRYALSFDDEEAGVFCDALGREMSELNHQGLPLGAIGRAQEIDAILRDTLEDGGRGSGAALCQLASTQSRRL